MIASLKRQWRSWEAHSPLPIYLLVRACSQAATFFMALVLLCGGLNLLIPGTHNLGPLDASFWRLVYLIPIGIAIAAIPLNLFSWYNVRRRQRGRPAISGGILPALLFPLVVFPAGRMLVERNTRAQILPLKWEVTQGKLLKYKSNGGTEDFFEPIVIYTYDVAGRTYTSSQVSFSGKENGLVPYEAANNWKRRVGKTVSVYYDPADPRLAALAPKAGVFYPGLFGSMLLIFAALYVWTLLAYRRAYYNE